ncbi:MAG: hypothetical protein NVS4B1_36590 [Ktedonobacteraceae bacterium]
MIATYDKGTWGELHNFPEWVISSRDGLDLEGYEHDATESWGEEVSTSIAAYAACDEGNDGYFVCIASSCATAGILAADYVSVLLLVKEFMHVLELEMKEMTYSMRIEEHEWKAKQMHSKFGYKCSH